MGSNGPVLLSSMSGAVHPPARMKHAMGRGKTINAVIITLNSSCLVVKIVIHSIGMGVLSQGNGVVKGVHDSAVM